jgi:hypothetical protein
MFFPFVLEDALLQVSGDADVEHMASASNYVCEIGPLGHDQDRTLLAVFPL